MHECETHQTSQQCMRTGPAIEDPCPRDHGIQAKWAKIWAHICFEWRLSLKQSFDLFYFAFEWNFFILEICFVYFRNVIRCTEIGLK